MSSFAKLRELFATNDRESCMQAVELAKSLGEDVVDRLIEGTEIRLGRSNELFAGSAFKIRTRRYPEQVPVVVTGPELRRMARPFRVAAALELACMSKSPTATRLRTTESLAMSGWVRGIERTQLDVGPLAGWSLRSLLLIEAAFLAHVEALEDLPLETLRLVAIDSFDLSEVRLPRLQRLVIQSYESYPGTRRVAPRDLDDLRTLVVEGIPHLFTVEQVAQLQTLRELFIKPLLRGSDVAVLCELPLQRLELSLVEARSIPSLPESLEVLSLTSSRTLVDFAPIARLKKLRRLDLSYTMIDDHRPLLELPELEQLRVQHTKLDRLPPELQAKADAWTTSDWPR